MKLLALVMLFVLGFGHALAQPGPRHDKRRAMSQEERQQMREQVRDAYRERPDRQDRQERRQLTQEEREKLRRDVQDANRDLRRR